MKISPTLLIAVVVLGTACTGAAHSSATTSIAGGKSESTEVPTSTIDIATECVHTDPGKLPVSVHRALSCPDGTSVSVQGIATTGEDGSVMLCDPAPAEFCLTIDGGTAMPAGGPSGATVGYTGTVSNGVLSVERMPGLALTPGSLSP